MNTKTNCAMNASHTPGKPDSRLPWRVVPPFYDSEDPNLWQVWTRFDDTPGSRNNYVVADDIQTEGEAQLIALAPTLLAQRNELRAALAGMLENYIELKNISLISARSDAPNWIGASLSPDNDVHVIAARAALNNSKD